MKTANFIQMESDAQNWDCVRDSLSHYLFYLFYSQAVNRVSRCVDIQIWHQTLIQTKQDSGLGQEQGRESGVS